MKKLIVPKKYQLFEQETGINRIISLFFRYQNKEFSLSDVAGIAKVSKSTASRILNYLKEIEFIQIVDLGIIWRIKANLESFEFISYKIVFNISLIYYHKIINSLLGIFKTPKCVVLFGSFRKGEDIEGSDIDIAIEMDNIKELQIINLPELKDLEGQLNRRINLYLFNRKTIDLNFFSL